MHKWALAVFATTIALSGGHALAVAHVQPTTDESSSEALAAERAQLLQGVAAMQNGDWKGGRDTLKRVLSDHQFSSLAPEEQFECQAELGIALYALDDATDAFPLLRQASETQWGDGEIWAIRLSAAAKVHAVDDEVTDIITLAKRWPAALAQFSGRYIYQMERSARMLANGRDQYVAMLEALFVAHWHPSDAFLSSDSLWLHLTEARLEKGDLAGAKEAASAVVTISSVVAMRIDKRFDAITSSDPSHFDIDVAFARDLAASRAAAAAAPDKLEGINQTATDLIITGKPADALAMLDKAIAESHLTEGKSQPFSDYADQINWTENNRAIALRNLGRIDESLEQLAKAATKSENGSPNVSQSINLAEAYNAAGRPKDALEAVGDIGTPSPYGRMALEYARACAHAQLHDDAGLGKSFEYIKAHVADAPAVYTDASICANDLDGAARAYIAAIEDPLQRTTALYYFQNFVRPTQREPMAAENYRRLLLVRDRADVRAVIEKYGRIVSLPFMDIGSE